MDKIRIGIVDDHSLFVSGLTLVLQQLRFSTGGIEIAFQSTESKRILFQAGDLDLLFLDLFLQDGDGLDLIKQLKEKYPQLRLIVLSMHTDVKTVREAMKRGADGFLSKSTQASELASSIQLVMAGEIFLGQDIQTISVKETKEIQTAAKPNRFNVSHHLTKREIEILELIAAGKSTKDIGSQLYISHNTVSVHRKNLMKKFGVNNSTSLIKQAFELNLLQS
ncbi:MAG TPA: response regulator transcription factor [Saprospiraceae bacterium]|nr:response regulator transcription factor [Saprospiraceae bacterium]